MSVSSAQLVKYAGSTGLSHWRNEYLPELIMGLDVRATRPDFAGCGVLVTLVKTEPSGEYRVRTCFQYQVGGSQHVAETKTFSSLRDAVKYAYGVSRKNFPIVVTRKFAVDMVGASL